MVVLPEPEAGNDDDFAGHGVILSRRRRAWPLRGRRGQQDVGGVGVGDAAARFLAAWTSIGFSRRFTPWSSAPRKMPGNARTLLTWLGKSERPVATTKAPAALGFVRHDFRHGVGQGEDDGPGVHLAHHFGVSTPGALTPMKMSAPLSAAARSPETERGLVISARDFLLG